MADLGSHIYFGVTLDVTAAAMRRPWDVEGQVIRAIPMERMLVGSMAPYRAVAPWSATMVFDHVVILREVEARVLEAVLAASFRRFYARSPDQRPFV